MKMLLHTPKTQKINRKDSGTPLFFKGTFNHHLEKIDDLYVKYYIFFLYLEILKLHVQSWPGYLN